MKKHKAFLFVLICCVALSGINVWAKEKEETPPWEQ